MDANLESHPTILRLLHALLWLCVCFALARHLLPNPFLDFVPPPGMLGGQARIYYGGVLPILGAPFGAGVGAVLEFRQRSWLPS